MGSKVVGPPPRLLYHALQRWQRPTPPAHQGSVMLPLGATPGLAMPAMPPARGRRCESAARQSRRRQQGGRWRSATSAAPAA